MHNLLISGDHFIDASGRRTMLRGINLGGSSKLPTIPDGATYKREGFFDHKTVSFVGRPFPLAEADEHFMRLKTYGFNFLRFLVTWEAIEHAGPGIYDEAYLDYLTQIVKKAGEYDFNLFIDPHEDVWSRFTGGDGAPGWTLELAGFDLHNLNASGAAVIHCIRGDPYPRMLWPTNNFKLAAASMWTLFFGGRDFAPSLTVDGISIQDYLQEHYINAIVQVAMRLKGMPNVIGYDTLNEPARGWIGYRDLLHESGRLTLYESPTVLQSMALGEGIPQNVDVWGLNLLGLRKTGKRWLNENGVRAWQTGRKCIWRTEGVWDVDARGMPVILKPDHFSRVNNQSVDFSRDYLLPFIRDFVQKVRAIDPQAVIFVEEEPDQRPNFGQVDTIKPFVNATHWYDVTTLLSKRFIRPMTIDATTEKIVLGGKKVERSFARQLAAIKHASIEMGNVPTLIGEFGIPFDMMSKKAYQSGNYGSQVAALDRSYRAMEINRLDTTLWNYTADNSNERGDLWNDEDFSIYSSDQRTDPESLDSGGRAWEAFLRPYPQRTAGTPKQFCFDYQSGTFQFEYIGDVSNLPTEIFVPQRQYPHGIEVTLSDGSYEYDPAEQRLIHHALKSRNEHKIIIRRI